MVRKFLVAYVSEEHKITSKVYDAFIKFKNNFSFKKENIQINKVTIMSSELEFLTGMNPSIVIFDNVDEKNISNNFIEKIKTISPLTYFIYFAKEYNEEVFFKILKKEIEFCVSLEFFGEELFFQTLRNIFIKVININKLNNVIIWGNNISMNLIDRRVWKSGHEIVLTKNEFEILKFFLENQDIFFSKEEIFKKVWGYDDDDVTGLVVQYIFKLKKKIGKENIIHSPDDGYCFKSKKD